MDPEKKRKLEEIKLRRKLLQEQLHKSEIKNTNQIKSVEDEANEALILASNIKKKS
jgi:hypothetical protein